MESFSPSLTVGRVACCECGVAIEPNSVNMCGACLSLKYDITEGITRTSTLYLCKFCNRYFVPPTTWMRAELESKELLSICLKKLKPVLAKVRLTDAAFVWTEEHSKRVKVKLTVQKEVLSGTILQQSFIVEFSIHSQMCDECRRAEAKDFWRACVQVRQRSEFKKTLFYLEQLLKHSAHGQATGVKPVPTGIDFFYANLEVLRTSLAAPVAQCEFGDSCVSVDYDEYVRGCTEGEELAEKLKMLHAALKRMNEGQVVEGLASTIARSLVSSLLPSFPASVQATIDIGREIKGDHRKTNFKFEVTLKGRETKAPVKDDSIIVRVREECGTEKKFSMREDSIVSDLTRLISATTGLPYDSFYLTRDGSRAPPRPDSPLHNEERFSIHSRLRGGANEEGSTAMADQWKEAYKTIYGKSPVKADYALAPSNIAKEVLESKENVKESEKGRNLFAPMRLKRPAQYSPVKQVVKKRSVQPSKEEVVKKPVAVPVRESPRKKLKPTSLFAASPVKKALFAPLSGESCFKSPTKTVKMETLTSTRANAYSVVEPMKTEQNTECRELARLYFSCRMDKGLMDRDEWHKLGYGDKKE